MGEGAGVFGLNGRTGEVLRWLMGLGVAGLVSYYTALGAVQERLTAVETTERDHYSEMMRRLDELKFDVRDVKVAVTSSGRSR